MALPNPNTNSDEKIGNLTNEKLTSLVEEQASTSDYLLSLVNITKMLLDSQERLFEKIVTMFDIQAEKTEMKDVAGAVAGKDSLGIAEALKNSMGSFGLGQALMLAFLAWVTGLDQFLRLKLLPKIAKGLSDIFGRIFRFENFKNIIKDLKPFKDFMTGFRRVGMVIGAVATPVQIKEFTTIFGKIGAFFGTIRNAVAPIITSISKFVMPVVNALKEVGSFLKSLAPVSGIARLLRFLGGPFTMALFAIFDFVSGFIKGFQEGGLLEGFKQGALEIIRGFITKPLDLLKDIVSWAAGKLGFKEFEKQLDSFSFTDLFNQLIKWLENFFPKIGDWVVSSWDKMSKAVENGINSVGEWWTSITTSVENFFSSIGQWVSDKISSAMSSIKNLFDGEEGAEGSMPSFDISKLLPSMDFEIPSAAKIKDEVLATVGEKINNTFQWLASQLPDIWPLNKLISFFSDAGISLAESLGAQNLSKYNASTGKIDIQPTTITETGAAVGAGSQQVSNMREERASGGAAIIAPNNSSTNIQTNNVSSANYSAPAPSARPRSPAMGMYAMP